MYLRSILVIAALAMPGAALAQNKGGQSKTLTGLAECGVLPETAETLDCACSAGFSMGDVWGSGPYTGDSSICTAALHAGVIGPDGGAVTVTQVPPLSAFPGSSANGVTTSGWDTSYDYAMTVAGYGAAEDVAECSGMPAGESAVCSCPSSPFLLDVWGSGPYTGDSDVCTAALHAGVIGKAGGTIRIVREPGLDSYRGTSQNGVSTMDWGAYDESFTVADPQMGGMTEPVFEHVGACGGLPAGDEPVMCTCGEVRARSVWGSGPYTGDSDVCTAAVHAGAIGLAGGEVVLVRVPGVDSYDGTDANGVTTRDWGSYGDSFEIMSGGTAANTQTASAGTGMATDSTEADNAVAETGEIPACTVIPDGVDDFTCNCGRGLARGDVWGMGPYTSDSDICTAARHAGIIRSFGGEVRVLRVQGLTRYTAGTGNGVSTSGWDEAYDSSIIFDMN